MMSHLFTPPPEHERGPSPRAFILIFGIVAVLISLCV
jgi:hypothetical protein